MITAGIDVGSASTKTVIFDAGEGRVLASRVVVTGAHAQKSARMSFEQALEGAGVRQDDVAFILGTGYGRFNIPFASRQITEIACHARGAHFLFPGTRTVIDIGGQDSKAIRVSEKGDAVDFVMNDKCAAGTGRFLEVIARVLEIGVDRLGELSERSSRRVEISSMCAVFAESEVVSLIASGVAPEDIADGVHRAVIDRVISLAKRISIIGDVTLTGGVVKNSGVLRALKDRIDAPVNVPEDPQIIGALGAAIRASAYA
ncbi:MAG: 2-hydroxyglutaryl-CoA dehydratase [Nitrospiraceae bacterium]|nr:MAG: 2-hydroxyglutaryl-CoA dehydratase [Nitrospiraceae bacterium]